MILIVLIVVSGATAWALYPLMGGAAAVVAVVAGRSAAYLYAYLEDALSDR